VKINITLFFILIILSSQAQDRSLTFYDNENVTIKLIDSTQFETPIDISFFKKNFIGKLIIPELDTTWGDYSFRIEKPEIVKRKRKYSLIIYSRVDPKDKKSLYNFSKGKYLLTAKTKNRKYVVDKLECLYVEI
jgi:hypothetical protein